MRKENSEAVEVHIKQEEGEPNEIELLILDNYSHLATYFTLKEWANFKKAVNSFNVEGIKPTNSEGTRIAVTIDFQYGDDVTLHLDDNNIMTLIGFTFFNWKKFKKQVNEFKLVVEGDK